MKVIRTTAVLVFSALTVAACASARVDSTSRDDVAPTPPNGTYMCKGASTPWSTLSQCSRMQCPDRPTTVNGCGPMIRGLKTLTEYGLAQLTAWLSAAPIGFNACCSTHDEGYGTCGTDSSGDRGNADAALGTCLTKTCKAAYGRGNPLRYSCLTNAWIIYKSVRAGGSSAYQAAQQSACQCMPDGGLPLVDAGKSVAPAGSAAPVASAVPTMTPKPVATGELDTLAGSAEPGATENADAQDDGGTWADSIWSTSIPCTEPPPGQSCFDDPEPADPADIGLVLDADGGVDPNQ